MQLLCCARVQGIEPSQQVLETCFRPAATRLTCPSVLLYQRKEPPVKRFPEVPLRFSETAT
jgi:hypothetical protein